MASVARNPGRDLRLDSLRGLMLVLLTVNHLPSVLSEFTDEPFGVASSAEGFVFLSGLLAGIVYTRRLRRDGSPGLWAALRGRAAMIWRWQFGGFVAALIAVHAVAYFFRFDSEKAPVLFYQHPWLSLVMGATFTYQPGMLDILPMYCAFVTVLPFVLEQFEKGRRWQVMAVSLLLWLSVQSVMGSSIDGAPLYPLHVGSFNLFAWQFIFFLGVLLGYQKAVDPAPIAPFRPWLFTLVLAVAVYGWGVQHLHWVPPWHDVVFGIMINKTALGLFRLTDFGCIAYLIAQLGRAVPKALTWPPLAFLGQHSIAVFSVQSVVGIVLIEFNWLFTNPWRNLATTLGAIGLLWVTAAVHERFGKRSTPRGAAPAAAPTDRSTVPARQVSGLPLAPGNDIRAA